MSQHDYVIANAGGAAVRADINSALLAVQSNNAGATAPSATAAGMFWLDTSASTYVLKIRDKGNNHWLTVGDVADPGADGIMPAKLLQLTASGTALKRSDGSGMLSEDGANVATLENVVLHSNVDLSGPLNTTGTAPLFAARAWINFNGTGTVAVNASGNVSSVTDNDPGDYTVNFTTAMPDANYSFAGNAKTTQGASRGPFGWHLDDAGAGLLAGSIRFEVVCGASTGADGARQDSESVSVIIFR